MPKKNNPVVWDDVKERENCKLYFYMQISTPPVEK